MSGRAGGRTAKYDYLIKLLLIGDSGKLLELCCVITQLSLFSNLFYLN